LAVEWAESLPSTHLQTKEWLEKGERRPPFLLGAEFQSAGRGRRGNAWVAPAGSSLLMTLGLSWTREKRASPQLPPTMLAALVAAEALDAFLPKPATLKWPNDLQARGRKIGGVMAESAGRDGLVLSFGLNVHQSAAQLPPPSEGLKSTSLALERAKTGTPLSEEDTRPQILEAFLQGWRDKWERGCSEDALRRLRQRCSTLGKRVRVEREGRPPLEGIADNLDQFGALIVGTSDGKLERCLSGHLREIEN
jgi:BirA family biotin operon repressor/biotin-[acetyl-CoA-carboxylase] ligase